VISYIKPDTILKCFRKADIFRNDLNAEDEVPVCVEDAIEYAPYEISKARYDYDH